MREITGSNWRVFASTSPDLAESMQQATNCIAGIQLLDPTAVIRVTSERDPEGGYQVLVIVEGV